LSRHHHVVAAVDTHHVGTNSTELTVVECTTGLGVSAEDGAVGSVTSHGVGVPGAGRIGGTVVGVVDGSTIHAASTIGPRASRQRSTSVGRGGEIAAFSTKLPRCFTGEDLAVVRSAIAGTRADRQDGATRDAHFGGVGPFTFLIGDEALAGDGVNSPAAVGLARRGNVVIHALVVGIALVHVGTVVAAEGTALIVVEGTISRTEAVVTRKSTALGDTGGAVTSRVTPAVRPRVAERSITISTRALGDTSHVVFLAVRLSLAVDLPLEGRAVSERSRGVGRRSWFHAALVVVTSRFHCDVGVTSGFFRSRLFGSFVGGFCSGVGGSRRSEGGGKGDVSDVCEIHGSKISSLIGDHHGIGVMNGNFDVFTR